MVTAGTGLAFTLGGGALMAQALGPMQVINAQAAVLENQAPEDVDWDKVEESNTQLNSLEGAFNGGTFLVISGLGAVTAGMVWGMLEKNKFAEEEQ